MLLPMASLLKVGNTWRAQARRKGHKSVTETFPTKAQAVAWARKVESEMDARRFNDTCGPANITLKERIDWYFDEIGAVHPFGKNSCRFPPTAGFRKQAIHKTRIRCRAGLAC
jgi:hypothetical protein